MQSDAKLTAVSKPNVDVVFSRSLSIVLGTPTSRSPAWCSRLAIVIDPSPPTVTRASMPCGARTGRTSSSVRSTSVHVPSGCCTGYAVGFPRFVVPMIVPPWWTMPRTDSRDSRTTPPFGYWSGVEQPVEAVADADDVPAAVARGERRSTDHGVQPRSVTAAGADGDALDVGGHTRTVPPGRGACLVVPGGLKGAAAPVRTPGGSRCTCAPRRPRPAGTRGRSRPRARPPRPAR